MDEILNTLYEKRKEYKGISEVVKLLKDDKKFKKVLIEGISANKITGFPEELWEKIEKQNIRGISNFTDVFSRGLNIDRCTVAAKQLSYSFDECIIAGGTLKCLINSKSHTAKDGRHTWIISNNKIYDTTFMLVIDIDISKKLGYKLENQYNPNIDPIYLAAKQFTNDKSLRTKSH
ncbi:MAG: hypothetical protein PHF21_04725 [Bacilli bacterium]|nr:hypothetical protein [Bacilli bacterium]